MARSSSAKKHEPVTALVPQRVVPAEFDDGDSNGAACTALAAALDASTGHVAKLVELMTRSYSDMVTSQKLMSDSFNDSLRAQIESTKVQQELLDKKEERKLKRDREKAQLDTIKEIGGDLRALLPVIINKLAKHPVASPAEAALVRPFIETLSERQLATIIQVFTPAQQAAFMQILNAIPDDPKGDIKKEPSNGAH